MSATLSSNQDASNVSRIRELFVLHFCNQDVSVIPLIVRETNQAALVNECQLTLLRAMIQRHQHSLVLICSSTIYSLQFSSPSAGTVKLSFMKVRIILVFVKLIKKRRVVSSAGGNIGRFKR